MDAYVVALGLEQQGVLKVLLPEWNDHWIVTSLTTSVAVLSGELWYPVLLATPPLTTTIGGCANFWGDKPRLIY
jgi:hypothetical protein